ncbi:MAG: hypothetical protein BJBARM4_0266 [Candidatus Parvarchaeum acidiphilum ARMAN-4]|uniref:Helicase HerA central domain-containing protein n=1 Tax=Candidatus Parvarchaeum acidiphilum ARMAN-4 TaxID=662760 RepID=D2EEW4_PARA4|nr:MAG: hypothetical protein BJBARM4_0266 [Candidatus Parvarchaeum acidiphilum ARMAN-4]
MEEQLQGIIKKLSLFREFTDTSKIEGLISRLSKTKDPGMQVFLLSNIMKEFKDLEAAFPVSDPLFPIIKRKEGMEIGSILYQEQKIGRLSLSLEDLNRNILIVGSTGHGKTSLIYSILKKASENGINYLIFDMKKDYRALGLGKDSVYIDANDLRINPLEVPVNTKEKEWAVHFADIFSDSFSLLIGSRDYLLENTINLCSSWDKNYPPRLADLLLYITLNGKRNDYFKVIEGRLKSLVSSTSMFDCNLGISFERMKDKNIIIGIENVGIAEQYFLVSFILSSFYYSNLGISSRKFNRLVVIDDAHSILDANKERDYAKGIPLIHSIIAKIREMGFGFIFPEQQVSSILSSAIQNTNTKFIGRVNLYSDLYRILPGNANVVSDFISKLNKSEFLVFNESIRPFCLFEADRVNIAKSVDPSMFAVKTAMDRQFLNFFKADSFSAKEESFLAEINSNYFLNLTLHMQNLSEIMDKEEFNSIKNMFLKNKVISQVSLDFPSGKTSKFLFINKDSNGKAGRIRDLNPLTEEEFFRNLFKYLVVNQLKISKSNFEEYEDGFLIKGLLKKYILVDYNIASLKRILETKFDSVIFLVNDNLSEQDVLAELIKESDQKQLLNMKALKIVHYKDFKI